MSKYYFPSENAEICTDIAGIRAYMKERDLTELTVFEAKRETGTGYFFCQAVGTCGEVGNCDRLCPDYIPNNGKSGRCKHYGYVYEATEKTRTVKL
jgi:hypothetical protein